LHVDDFDELEDLERSEEFLKACRVFCDKVKELTTLMSFED